MNQDCEVISVQKQFIPSGARLVEAYLTEDELIIIGEPDEVEGHDCDQMGCATLSHVIYRFARRR